MCDCKCKFDGRKYISDQKWHNNKFWCGRKKHHSREKDCTWNPATSSSENDKYSASIIDDSVITCDKIIEETKVVTTNVNERNAVCKAKTLSYLPFY